MKEKTSFGQMKKTDSDVVELINAYNRTSKSFRIGEKLVKFQERAMQLIFGLRFGANPLLISNTKKPEDSRFTTKWFGKVTELTQVVINEQLLEAAGKIGKTNQTDAARLVCLYLCVSLFYAKTGRRLSWAFIGLVENLETMIDYAWSESITDWLMSSLDKSCAHPTTVSGCVIALLFWFLEHTTIVKPIKKKAMPRLIKWDLMDLHDA